ncbi:hypothetical protein [Specibacter cremeus]|uniref:hypothetical protein n=1 Tax=Specibacter cremeus TaxID=1629051 RepID=UPI000F77C807|nr:hypothetical protein [Specibacter cremeus]
MSVGEQEKEQERLSEADLAALQGLPQSEVAASPRGIAELPQSGDFREQPQPPSKSMAATAAGNASDRLQTEEAERILQHARADATPISRLGSADQFDPLGARKNGELKSENGFSIVHSFINRTVFFDYFRHVANKRFPDLGESERVEALVQADDKIYRRALDNDHALKLVTTYGLVLLGFAIVFKALFL